MLSGSLSKYFTKSDDIVEPGIKFISERSTTEKEKLTTEVEENVETIVSGDQNDVVQTVSMLLPLLSNDAANWLIPVPDSVRLHIIKQGSEVFQHKEGPFPLIERHGERVKGYRRSLSTSWFYTTLPNGTKFLRKWMVYSPSQNILFCFCCRVFASENDKDKKFVKGFNKWWKLNPIIVEHETSLDHMQNFEKWKALSVNIKLNKTIDAENQIIANMEAKKWRNILHRLLDITLFLAKQNLAFRGHREHISSEQRGNFLEMVKLLSKYDPVLKEHYLKVTEAADVGRKITHYLSKDTQNEFIFELSKHVKEKIVEDIKKAKYYGIIFDSTPDQSKTDQMSEIIRYVHIEGDVVEIRESFLGFFALTGKNATSITNDILQKLVEDGLDINLCRSQGYDNAASMAGIHGGVQRKIREVNPKALFTPCANHSLNLSGVHSFSSVAASVTCFATLERLYAFFSVSTHRWEMLMLKIGRSLKFLSTTRWSAHHESVEVVVIHVEAIIDLLDDMCDPEKENLDTRSAATLLLPTISDFSFLCFLKFWSIILKEVNIVQTYLQKPGITIDKALIKQQELKIFLQDERETSVEESVEYGTKKCEIMGVDIQRRGRRKTKKTLSGELAKDAGLTIVEEIRRAMFECVDRFTKELSTRVAAFEQISQTFKIIHPKIIIEAENQELEFAVDDLNRTLNEFERENVVNEIKRLRRFITVAKIEKNDFLAWTAEQTLQFIVKWDFSESLPNLSLILQYFLTICVSVASCERSFSKLKLIKNYLRSTMGQERLQNLAILSIENEFVKNVDFDKVIDSFSEAKARKVNITIKN